MSTISKVLIAILAIFVLAGVIYLVYAAFFKKKSQPTTTSEPTTTKTVSIPQEILNNKYGFLSGGPGEYKKIKDYGAAWVRPHPGPFLWESMQESKGGEISFTKSDKMVKEYQEAELGVLATLWPFADWDQKTRTDASACKVSPQDEFLPEGQIKGVESEMDYISEYRCNPNDWDAYAKWLNEVVERYDGDGKDDMSGLEIPIKYWEVLNEPDLEGPEDEESRLDFYKQGPEDYAQLLIKTYQTIKSADAEAKVLIAGAAGDDERFLNFYKNALKNQSAANSFDIGNIHCLSSGEVGSFNVEPYKNMLESFGIKKPIWVTEAQGLVSTDADVNATQTLHSSKKALELGATRLFFISYEFERKAGPGGPPLGQISPPKAEIEGDDAQKAFQIITSN